MPADIWEVDDVAMMDEQKGLLRGESAKAEAIVEGSFARFSRPICEDVEMLSRLRAMDERWVQQISVVPFVDVALLL